MKSKLNELEELLSPGFEFTLRPFRVSYLTFFLLLIVFLVIIWTIGFIWVWPKNKIKQFLRWVGAASKRVGKTIRELERKTFHLSGLLLPVNYHLLLTFVSGFTRYHGTLIMSILAGIWLILDLLRINIEFIKKNFPLTSLARANELNNISGVTYFLSGCWLAVTFFPPKIAITAMLYLILGDMSAAIFGITFGHIKLIGKKSLEGTSAMFIVCFVIGINMFWNIHMREYPVFLGAFAASLVELIEPWGINDNLTIPLLSCIALQFGFHRIASCDPNWDITNLLDPSLVSDLIEDKFQSH